MPALRTVTRGGPTSTSGAGGRAGPAIRPAAASVWPTPRLATRPGRAHTHARHATPPSPSTATPAPIVATADLPGLGRVDVRPLTPADAGAAAVLVARAFASAGSAPLGDVESFIASCLAGGEAAPAGLVADLVAPEPGVALPPGKASVAVGFAAVAGPARPAVEAAARDAGVSPAALPPGAAVLTNVAVDPRRRRAGVGRLLVAGAEAWAQAAGAEGLWLEPRPGPGGAAARGLYESCGYADAAAPGVQQGQGSGGLGGLLGRFSGGRRPELMAKTFVK